MVEIVEKRPDFCENTYQRTVALRSRDRLYGEPAAMEVHGPQWTLSV